MSDICPTFALIYCKFYRSNLCSANRKPLTYKFLEFPKQVCVIHCVTPINHTPPVLVMFIITIHNFLKVNILIFSEYFHCFIRLSTYMKHALYCMVHASSLENIFNTTIIRTTENKGEDLSLLITKDALLNNYIGRVV